MYDSYKIFEKYPELKDEPEPIQVNVGRALQELLECCINSAWGSEVNSHIEVYQDTDYEYGSIEKCPWHNFEEEYGPVLKRIERHPATLKMNYEELPKYVKEDFEAKADYLLKKMKEQNFRHPIDIHKFLGEITTVHSPGQRPITTSNQG